MKLFYSKENVVAASLDDQTMYIKWMSLMDDKAIEECCLAQVDQVKRGIDKLIIDVSEAKGVPSNNRQKWFGETLFPQFAEQGLKIMVTVLPNSAITKLASKKWMSTASTFGFQMFDAKDLPSAKELVGQF